VPFTYTIQTRYLVDHPVNLSYFALFGILLVQLLGLYIFRAANGQKDEFRSDSNHPKWEGMYMSTERGTKLLTKGWWGRARHINYLGDIIMSFAWGLPCGFDHAIPYFYNLYFILLLGHRERRDDDKCSRKYKKDWQRYCSVVPHRIIPYVY